MNKDFHNKKGGKKPLSKVVCLLHFFLFEAKS